MPPSSGVNARRSEPAAGGVSNATGDMTVMAARPVWKGQMRLSLVSIPVGLYSATASRSRVTFRQIHKPSGKPIRYEKVVRGIGPVDPADIFKGFEVGDDEYVLIEPDEIAAIRLETQKTFELVQFVGYCDISPLYFDKPYYLVPSDELAEEAYRVVRDALRATERIGLGQLTLRGKEYLVAVKPSGDGLLLETLHYADELRDAEPLFSAVADTQSDAELLDVATSLIERKTAPFDASAYRDRYAEALRALVDAKVGSRKTPRVRADDGADAASDNVVDLMSALKKSLENADGTAGGAKPRKRAAKKKSTGRR